MNFMRMLCSVILVFGLNVIACHSSDGGATGHKEKLSSKGAALTMKTFYMGRFALDVPVEMKQAVQAHQIRSAVIEEFAWPISTSREEDRNQIWADNLTKIKKLKLPDGIKKHVIEERNILLGERWAKAIFYYNDYINDDMGNWDFLLDAGDTGVWLKYNGLLTAKEEMLNLLKSIAKSYVRKVDGQIETSPHMYYLKTGALKLPYLDQEKTYARFEDHSLNLKLEVQMDETQEVEKMSVVERLVASIATRFAPGVDVNKIRARSRIAAGLKGDELVMQMRASGEDTQIQFCWEYHGKVDSGEHPEIQITMETPDGNLDAKLKIWDQILDSFKPMYR